MPSSSFYVDGETYSTALVSSADQPGTLTPSQAPSSFYPDGATYEQSNPDTSGAYATQAAASAAVALASQNAASTSASSAAASAASATAHDSDALTQAQTAYTNAQSALSSAGAAATSATAASTSASNAATSATNAAGSATAASGSASAASTSATNAHTSELNAATSASNASTSATNAAASVQAVAGAATPLQDGTAAVGTSTKWAHEDHVHPTDTSRAPLASPALTGTPTAPTAAAATNTTQIATTAFVLANVVTVPPVMPQGRLTLTSGVAVTTANVALSNVIYYTPACGRYVPIWTGTKFNNVDMGGELSQLTTDTTKSPAAVVASTVYDMFVWNDAGTMRCTRGPSWSAGATAGSNSARGQGAGSTQLSLVSGILVNAFAITNGPAAGYGTYVGTIMSDASSLLTMSYGGTGAGGIQAYLGVWNAYNRVAVRAKVSDSTSSWNYTSSAIRAVNGSSNNSIAFVTGSAVDALDVNYAGVCTITPTAAAYALWGFALNSSTTFDRTTGAGSQTAAGPYCWLPAVGKLAPVLGSNSIVAVEQSDGTHAATFSGDGSNVYIKQGLELLLPM